MNQNTSILTEHSISILNIVISYMFPTSSLEFIAREVQIQQGI